MDKNKKIELVETLSEKFKNSSALYFARYTGMNVLQATELRSMFKNLALLYQAMIQLLTYSVY